MSEETDEELSGDSIDDAGALLSSSSVSGADMLSDDDGLTSGLQDTEAGGGYMSAAEDRAERGGGGTAEDGAADRVAEGVVPPVTDPSGLRVVVTPACVIEVIELRPALTDAAEGRALIGGGLASGGGDIAP